MGFDEKNHNIHFAKVDLESDFDQELVSPKLSFSSDDKSSTLAIEHDCSKSPPLTLKLTGDEFQSFFKTNGNKILLTYPNESRTVYLIDVETKVSLGLYFRGKIATVSSRLVPSLPGTNEWSADNSPFIVFTFDTEKRRYFQTIIKFSAKTTGFSIKHIN